MKTIGRRSLPSPRPRQSFFQEPESAHGSIASSEAPPIASPTCELAQAENEAKNKEAKGGQVHTDIEDNRKELIAKPKTKTRSFQGPKSDIGSIIQFETPLIASPTPNPPNSANNNLKF